MLANSCAAWRMCRQAPADSKKRKLLGVSVDTLASGTSAPAAACMAAAGASDELAWLRRLALLIKLARSTTATVRWRVMGSVAAAMCV